MIIHSDVYYLIQPFQQSWELGGIINILKTRKTILKMLMGKSDFFPQSQVVWGLKSHWFPLTLNLKSNTWKFTSAQNGISLSSGSSCTLWGTSCAVVGYFITHTYLPWGLPSTQLLHGHTLTPMECTYQLAHSRVEVSRLIWPTNTPWFWATYSVVLRGYFWLLLAVQRGHAVLGTEPRYPIWKAYNSTHWAISPAPTIYYY